MSLSIISDYEQIVIGREYWAFRLNISDSYIIRGNNCDIMKVIAREDSYSNVIFCRVDKETGKPYREFGYYQMVTDGRINWRNRYSYYLCESEEDAISTKNALIEQCIRTLDRKRDALLKEFVHA